MFKGTNERGTAAQGTNVRDRPALQLSQKQYFSDECISIYFYKSIYTHLRIYIFFFHFNN